MQKQILRLFLLLSIAFINKPLFAQDVLVDYTFLGNRSKILLGLLFQRPVDYAVDLYKVRYKTLDVNGEPDTASGLLALPVVPVDKDLPMVVYCHGTTDGPLDVPSRLAGGYEAAMAYAAFGFATIAPDYLGMGDARGFHPYVHAASEASASLDILFAAYEYLEFHDPDLDPNFLFLAGYSQGGQASMALQKEIDDFWSIIIPVTAATHMSGPYDMSGVMRDRMIGDVPYGIPAYIAYVVLGYDQVYDLYSDLNEIFKTPYSTSIEKFYNGTILLDSLNALLTSQLAAAGDSLVKDMLQDTFLASVSSNPNHKFNVALRDNDRYAWAPTSPTRLYYCEADEQVPYENALVTEAAMQGLGAADVLALSFGSNLGHGPCALPAISASVEYFLSFVNGTGTKELTTSKDELQFYPNPTSETITVNWEPAKNGFDYWIYDTNGKAVASGTSSYDQLSLSNLPGGLYMILCSAGNETKMGRVLRQ